MALRSSGPSRCVSFSPESQSIIWNRSTCRQILVKKSCILYRRHDTMRRIRPAFLCRMACSAWVIIPMSLPSVSKGVSAEWQYRRVNWWQWNAKFDMPWYLDTKIPGSSLAPCGWSHQLKLILGQCMKKRPYLILPAEIINQVTFKESQTQPPSLNGNGR